jgi:hypothetical protein
MKELASSNKRNVRHSLFRSQSLRPPRSLCSELKIKLHDHWSMALGAIRSRIIEITSRLDRSDEVQAPPGLQISQSTRMQLALHVASVTHPAKRSSFRSARSLFAPLIYPFIRPYSFAPLVSAQLVFTNTTCRHPHHQALSLRPPAPPHNNPTPKLATTCCSRCLAPASPSALGLSIL